jgi:hypothetical protein
VGQSPHGGNDGKTAVFVQNCSSPHVPVRLTGVVHGKRVIQTASATPSGDGHGGGLSEG